MRECDTKAWASHLETWKKNDPTAVYYPGHGSGKGGAELIDANLAYLHGVEAEVAQAKGKDDASRLADAKQRVLAKFPDYKGMDRLDAALAEYVQCRKHPGSMMSSTKQPQPKATSGKPAAGKSGMGAPAKK
jgi:hypothetical protein